MNRISVTIEGATWGEVIEQMTAFVRHPVAVQAAPSPTVGNGPATSSVGPFPPFSATTVATAGERVQEFWPVGDCPVHHKPFQVGKYGPFCSSQGGNGPLNKKGYCDLAPGLIYAGKGIPLLPVTA